jgi:hypothetical protein
MSSEWMKVMLEEIARKKAEAEQQKAECEQREFEAQRPPATAERRRDGSSGAVPTAAPAADRE